MKPQILIILPILAELSHAQSLKQSLVFLEKTYCLRFLDPLSLAERLSSPDFYEGWKKWFQENASQFHAFLGFSFGGVVLQQCFASIQKNPKPILLFSSPCYADHFLKAKLEAVIQLCDSKQILPALSALYSHVVLDSQPHSFLPLENEEASCWRLSWGLRKILETDSRLCIAQRKVPFTHFIGAQSRLINQAHIQLGRQDKLYLVPHAGMRVLEDNPAYCQSRILQLLRATQSTH